MRPRRRKPKGAWVLLGSAIVRLARVARPRMLGSAIVRLEKVARPRMRASLPLLVVDDAHRHRLPPRALRTTECQDNHSVSGTLCVLASLPQPELEVRSLRNAARQYPCARPLILFSTLLKVERLVLGAERALEPKRPAQVVRPRGGAGAPEPLPVDLEGTVRVGAD